MKNTLWTLLVALMGVTAFSSVAQAQANAIGQARNFATLYDELKNKTDSGGPAPKRDLTGVWTGPIGAMKGDIPPMTPLGQKLFSLNKPESKFGTANSNDPLNTCDPLGVPRNLSFETRGLSFTTMPERIILLHQYQKVWRDVWMDGRELPKKFDTRDGVSSRWYGYSVGHWDGDYTLVIDTVGSSDGSWLDTVGHPHSVDMHVEERYTRVDHNHLHVVVTVDDPQIYTKSFVLGTNDFIWMPKQEMDEQLCVPSEAITYRNSISLPSFGESPKAN